MSAKMKLPIGVENFEEIRTEGFYYVDKTSLITELLSNWGKVNLFTRPRRFGKSLNMSMLKSFFEPGTRKEIFEGLAISKEEELCERYMGKFPVISISLKGVDGEDFDGAKEMLRSCIGSEAQRFSFLRQSDRLTEDECRQYKALAAIDDRGIFAMPDALLSDSLLRLSQLLCKYYGQKVIILIDEYDVPLDKAYQSGYYDAMVRLLRGLFIQTLKGNDSMYFAVLTGCLRISKESIFTGLNNLKVLSITDVKYNEYFGFTDSEVRELLEYYGLEDAYGTVKEWYDGYRFGNVEVYCPWDVINYCYDLRDNLLAAPQNYWANTSSNDIVKKFIKKAKAATKREIEELVAGRSVKKEVIQELTYYDLDSSVDNLWSILFTTGYLTRSGVEGDAREKGQYELVIPNKEIHRVFVMQIQEWFKEEVVSGDKGQQKEGVDMNVKLPVGIDNFSKIRDGGFYFIDKTGLIKELLDKEFEANLITRPRRFGKTLTMSMLEDFFDISRDSKAHFEGLKISEETELCQKWMNQWPVVFITLKSVEGLSFQSAYERLRILLAGLFRKHEYLLQGDNINKSDAVDFVKVRDKQANMDETTNALVLLTRMMAVYYGKPVILLVDEYDVPLLKADDGNYYAEMLDVIRSLLGAVKTNDSLKFAVVTGCLRIAKESIFTGTNNFVTDTIMGGGFFEAIGFTENDVQKILTYTGFSKHAEELRFWYDGYRFGNARVYCPWDVLNHLAALQMDASAAPKSYWENTSHNNIIRRFIEREDLWKTEYINEDFETLLQGGCIVKKITENLTYDLLHSSADNLWSLLYLSGYLTRAPKAQAEGMKEKENGLTLMIPNEEIRRLFKTTVVTWFEDKVRATDRSELFEALWNLQEEECSKILSRMVFDTISYNDYKEDFYHAFVAGVLSFAGYKVKSNDEEGEGRPDIVLRDERRGRAIVIEIKRADTFRKMDDLCAEALKQIEERRYTKGLEDEFEEILGYGICFFKKRCRVKGKRCP